MSRNGRVGNDRTGWIVRDGAADLRRRRRMASTLSLSARPERVTLDTARTAVIVVDMQNDFCADDGWLAHIGVDVAPLRTIVEPINQLTALARSLEIPVIFLNWGNRPDRMNLPPSVAHVYNPDGSGVGIGDALPNGAHVLEQGSWSAKLIDGLNAEVGDTFIDKYRMSGFIDTELDSVLRNLDVSALLFAGVNLDQCVYATLTEATARGYDCVLLEDCCATTSPEAAAIGTLYNVAQCFGFVGSVAALEESAAECTATRRPVEHYASRKVTAHRISAGDTVKLCVLRRPDDLYDASVFLEIWDPGGSQPPNSHPASVETFYFLEGEGIAHSDGAVQPVHQHEYIVLPPKSLHRIENIGEGRLYAITTMIPDAGFCALVERGVVEQLDTADLTMLGRTGARDR